MNIKKNVIFLLLLTTIGCNNKSVRTDIIRSVENHYKSPNSDSVFVYNINKFIDFDWDTLYIFGEFTTAEEISSELGFNCNCSNIGDSKESIIFVKEFKIVHSENANLRSENYKLQFNPKDWKKDGYIKYSKSDTVFIVIKDYSINGRIFYNVFPEKFEQ
jgi:hypothetical protein